MSESDDDKQGSKQESQRDVLVALLGATADACAYRYANGELCEPVKDAERVKWLARFDEAAYRTAQLEVFVDTLASMLKEWVKRQAGEAASWIKPGDQLPEDQQEVLVLIDWRDTAVVGGILYSIAIFGTYEGAEENDKWRWYTDDHGALCTEDVARWRPLPALPLELTKGASE